MFKQSMFTSDGLTDIVSLPTPWILKWGMPIVVSFLICVIFLGSIITVQYSFVTNFIVICKEGCLSYNRCSNALIVESVVNMKQFHNMDIKNDISIIIDDGSKQYAKGKISEIATQDSLTKDSVKINLCITDLSYNIEAMPGAIGKITLRGEETLLNKLVDNAIFGVLKRLTSE